MSTPKTSKSNWYLDPANIPARNPRTRADNQWNGVTQGNNNNAYGAPNQQYGGGATDHRWNVAPTSPPSGPSSPGFWNTPLKPQPVAPGNNNPNLSGWFGQIGQPGHGGVNWEDLMRRYQQIAQLRKFWGQGGQPGHGPAPYPDYRLYNR